MHVEERMTRNVRSCRAADSLATAAARMWEGDCGCLPVVDELDHVCGMITDRDICMAALLTGRPLRQIEVAHAMARDVTTARCGDSLHEAQRAMRERQVHRLPVLDDQQRLVGILSSNDLLVHLEGTQTNGSLVREAIHLVRTLAEVGLPRTGVPMRILALPGHAPVVLTPRPELQDDEVPANAGLGFAAARLPMPS